MIVDIDISQMKEDKQYGYCPYCGNKEPEKTYKVNGKSYPFSANVQHMNDTYAICNYGVTTWWNEIHCCKKCKKQYYS